MDLASVAVNGVVEGGKQSYVGCGCGGLSLIHRCVPFLTYYYPAPHFLCASLTNHIGGIVTGQGCCMCLALVRSAGWQPAAKSQQAASRPSVGSCRAGR